jgi:hypothetical protein
MLTSYNFEARLPVDHAIAIGQIIIAGEAVSRREDALELSGAAIGELSAWLRGEVTAQNKLDPCNYTVEECMKVLQEPGTQNWLALVPVILQIIKLLKEHL